MLCALRKRSGFHKIGKHKNANTIEREIVLTSIAQSTTTEKQRELPAAEITRWFALSDVHSFIRIKFQKFTSIFR